MNHFSLNPSKAMMTLECIAAVQLTSALALCGDTPANSPPELVSVWSSNFGLVDVADSTDAVGIGDVDSDGFGDLAVLIPHNASFHSNDYYPWGCTSAATWWTGTAGKIVVVSGKTKSALYTLSGTLPSNNCAFEIIELNGCNGPDSCQPVNAFYQNCFDAYLVGAANSFSTGPSCREVIPLNDIDGDGSPDFGFFPLTGSGPATFYCGGFGYGPYSGLQAVSGKTGEPLHHWIRDEYVLDVAALGDLTNDGRSETAVLSLVPLNCSQPCQTHTTLTATYKVRVYVGDTDNVLWSVDYTSPDVSLVRMRNLGSAPGGSKRLALLMWDDASSEARIELAEIGGAASLGSGLVAPIQTAIPWYVGGVGDFNNNGFDDMVVALTNGSTSEILVVDGDQQEVVSSLSLPFVCQGDASTISDINGDDFAEIAFPGQNGEEILVFSPNTNELVAKSPSVPSGFAMGFFGPFEIGAEGSSPPIVAGVVDFANGQKAYVALEAPRNPVLIIPGTGGTYAKDLGDDMDWVLTRGIDPNFLEIDPLGQYYHDLVKTLENVGYVQNKDLFLVNYDWRLTPGPEDLNFDGVISGISAPSITDGVYEYGVDYLGEMLRRVKQENPSVEKVNVICHSIGGLVARTYIQSAAYGNLDSFGKPLPTIDQLIMIGVPNRGSSKAWNPMHDNFNIDLSFKLLLSKMFLRAFTQVVYKFKMIVGPPQAITMSTIADASGLFADPIKLIQQYVPTLRCLLATYPFLNEGEGNKDVNQDPELRNNLVLDLNGGLDFYSTPPTDKSPFAEMCTATAIFGVNVETPTSVKKYTGPFNFGTKYPQRFAEYLPHIPDLSETWYNDQWQVAGDGTVPLASSKYQFVGDTRVKLAPFIKGANTAEEVGHTSLMYNFDVQKLILDILGADYEDKDISTDQHLPEWKSGTKGIKITLVLDPVEGFVVDGQGRRLGYSAATGALTEIPDSRWVGNADGFGWAFGAVVEPLKLELTGLGGDYYAQVSYESEKSLGGLVEQGTLAKGESKSTVVPIEQRPSHDLAVVKIKAPRTINLSPASPTVTKTVTVSIQNRGPGTEVFANAATLAAAVRLDVVSLGECPNATAVLVPPKKFPVKLAPKKSLKVKFHVTFDCVNDEAATTKTEAHDDFMYMATVHREVIDGEIDTHSGCDSCPRPPLPEGEDKKFKDKGCGAKDKATGKLGAAVLTDVIVK